MATMTDIPTSELVFVDPDEVVPTWRIGLWAEPGQGKSVAACTAPGPILVVSADRPTAYMYVRKHHARHWWNPDTGERLREGDEGAVEVPAKEIHETRFLDWQTMENVYRYIRENVGRPGAIRTVVIDPLSNIYDYVVSIAPKERRKDESDTPNYQWINEKILGFIKSLRPFDVNVILIGHVKEPRKGSVMVGPNFGGPALTEKVLRELDIVAHVKLLQLPPVDPDDEDEKPRFRSVGQVQTLDTNLICKDGTNALGAKRVLNLSRWFELCTAELSPEASSDGDLPWAPGPKPAAPPALEDPDEKLAEKLAAEHFPPAGETPPPEKPPATPKAEAKPPAADPVVWADGAGVARLRNAAQGLKGPVVQEILGEFGIEVKLQSGLYGLVPAGAVDAVENALQAAPREAGAKPAPTRRAAGSGLPDTDPAFIQVLAKLADRQSSMDVKGAFVFAHVDFPKGAQGNERFAHLTDEECERLHDALSPA